jgi:agmatine deiminase
VDAPPSGAHLPAETAVHARTLIAWPTETRRRDLWGDATDAARCDYARIARTIARFEPLTMVADPRDASSARAALGEEAEVLELAIDDSWLRDSGPIVVVADDGERHAITFAFNAWGAKHVSWEHDATIARRLAEHFDLPVHRAPIVLEGGAIATDGTGLFVTTERCLLNPNRNPGLARADVEGLLAEFLGATQVIWLVDAIAEDDGTDGHVDNVVAFFAPRGALLQGCDDERNPNAAIAADNRERLTAAGIDVVEVPVLPYAAPLGERVPVPYVNLYPVNGAVLVPTCGHPSDGGVLSLIGRCYPDREVVAVPGALLAHGGGGVHCITQQLPA